MRHCAAPNRRSRFRHSGTVWRVRICDTCRDGRAVTMAATRPVRHRPGPDIAQGCACIVRFPRRRCGRMTMASHIRREFPSRGAEPRRRFFSAQLDCPACPLLRRRPPAVRADEIPRRHRRAAGARRRSGAALPRRRSRLRRRLRRRRYLLRDLGISDLRHDRRGYPQRIVLARRFLQAPDPAHSAGAVRDVPGHQRSGLCLLPAGRTRGLCEEPRQRGRLGFEHLFCRRRPAISMRRPKPSRCCIPGRWASRSSST